MLIVIVIGIGIVCLLVAAFCVFGSGVECEKNSGHAGIPFVLAMMFGVLGAFAFYTGGQYSIKAQSVTVYKLELGKVYEVRDSMPLRTTEQNKLTDKVLVTIYEPDKLGDAKLYLLDTVPPKVFIKTQDGRYLPYHPEKK